MKKLLAVLLSLALLGCGHAYAASLGGVDIDQTVQNGQELYVFFHASDENDQPLTDLAAENVALELGGQALTGELTGQGGDGTGYVFAVDVSTSMTAEQFAGVQEQLKNWVGAMGPQDMAAIVTFGAEVTTVTDFSSSINTLQAVINGLAPNQKATMLYSGILRAMDIAARQGEGLPLRRAVVLISDGVDYSDGSVSLQEGRQKAEDASIALYVAGITGTEDGTGLAQLGEAARATGGRIRTADKDHLAEALEGLRGYIDAGYSLKVPVPAGMTDGSAKGLILTVTYGGMSADDSTDVRLKAAGAAPVSAEETAPAAEQPQEEQEQPQTEPPQTGEEEPAASQTPAAGEPEESETPQESSSGAKSVALIVIAAVLAVGVALGLFFSLKNRKKKIAGLSERDKARSVPSADGGETPTQATILMEPGTVLLGENDTDTLELDKPGMGKIILTDLVKGMSYTCPPRNRISIGRKDGANDVVIRDSRISSAHCEIIRENGHIYVRDAGSSNGTFIISGGAKYQADTVSGREILPGDELLIGTTRLELTVE